MNVLDPAVGRNRKPVPARQGRLESIRGMVGLAYRAGRVVVGVAGVKRALGHGGVGLVLLSTDGSPGQKKRLVGLCRRTKVHFVELVDGVTLGRWLGRERVTAAAVVERHLARRLADFLDC